MLEDRGKMPLPHVFLANENIKLIMMGKNSGSGFQPRIICSAVQCL
jgi:hypothetical protein